MGKYLPMGPGNRNGMSPTAATEMEASHPTGTTRNRVRTQGLVLFKVRKSTPIPEM